jgi:hypothetical protein
VLTLTPPLLAGRRRPFPASQLLHELASQYNKQPIPELRQRHGLRLPPEADCLTAPNFQLVRPPREAPPHDEPPQQQPQGMDVDEGQLRAAGHVIEVRVAPDWRPAAGLAPQPGGGAAAPQSEGWTDVSGSAVADMPVSQ